MRAFLRRNRGRLIFWVTLLFLVTYLLPEQRVYYLDADIDNFKISYLRPWLIGVGIIICAGVFIVLMIDTRSFWVSIRGLLITAFFTVMYMYIFHNQFLEASLFINRLSDSGNIQRQYFTAYVMGAEQPEQDFSLYELPTKKMVTERKLIGSIYTKGLSSNDTVIVKFDIGIFGVPFQSSGFDRYKLKSK